MAIHEFNLLCLVGWLQSLNAKTGLFSKRMKIIHRDPMLHAQRVAAIKVWNCKIEPLQNFIFIFKLFCFFWYVKKWWSWEILIYSAELLLLMDHLKCFDIEGFHDSWKNLEYKNQGFRQCCSLLFTILELLLQKSLQKVTFKLYRDYSTCVLDYLYLRW